MPTKVDFCLLNYQRRKSETTLNFRARFLKIFEYNVNN